MDEEIHTILANRWFIYSLLSRVFGDEPDPESVELLGSSELVDQVLLVVDEHAEDRAALVTGLRETAGFPEGSFSAYALGSEPMPREMRETNTVSDEVLESLKDAYTKIFVGPGTLKASPWESMHRTKKRVLFQPGVLEVRTAYKAAGYLPERYRSVSDDSIGLECDFMANLARDAEEAYETGDIALCLLRLRQSAAFLDEHLLPWIDSLADAIAEHYGNGFYARFARLAASVMKRDVDVLAALQEELEPSE